MGLAGPVVLGAALLLVLAVACSPDTASTAAPSAPGSSPGSSAAGSPRPKQTAWPTLTVEASIALGAADNDFTAMAADVVSAVSSEDATRMLTVLNASLKFLTENQKNIPRLQAYDATKSVGDRLAAAYATMIAGATQARDGLASGNAHDIETGLTTFFDGNKAYVAISPDLGDLAEQAFFMKRQLLR